jgi:isocitrate/isopropylmalate dehydrogenase
LAHLTIAVIPGHGVGQEVITEALRVLDRVSHFEYEHFDWGGELSSLLPSSRLQFKCDQR